MSQAIAVLQDAFVSKGYQGAPQAKFNKTEGKDRGNVSFKVNIKVYDRREKKEVYNNYTVKYWCSEGDRLIGILNTPGVRVCITGIQTQEEFNGNKYIEVDAKTVEPVFGSYGEVKPSSEPASVQPEIQSAPRIDY